MMTNTHKTINMLIKDKELSFLKRMDSLVLHKTPSKTKSYVQNGERITYETKGVEEDYLKIWTIPHVNKTMALSFNFEKDIVTLSTEIKIPVSVSRNFAENKNERYEEAKNHQSISYSPEDFKEKLKEYLKVIRKNSMMKSTNIMLNFFGIEGF